MKDAAGRPLSDKTLENDLQVTLTEDDDHETPSPQLFQQTYTLAPGQLEQVVSIDAQSVVSMHGALTLTVSRCTHTLLSSSLT